jgi:endonuclease/exonuclease/phosphatase family metal-dependent hydrolase
MPEPAMLVSWNLQGLAGLDAPEAASVLRDFDADVVCAQEIDPRQFRALRTALGWRHGHWSFKHWPVKRLPEGLAVLSSRPVSFEAYTLSRRQPPWGWQRRIAQIGRADALPGLAIVNTHLAADDPPSRGAQVERLLRRVKADVIVGDLNEQSGPALDALLTRNYCASAAHPDPTNRSPGVDRRSTAPDQVLDWIFVSAAVEVLETRVPDWSTVAPISDHLPVAATLRLRTGTGDPT